MAEAAGEAAPGAAPVAPSLFDGELARAGSCYTGVCLADPEHERHHAPHHEDLELRTVPEGKLFPDEDDPEPSWEVRFIHEQWRAVAGAEAFPCTGARIAMGEMTYRFGLYDELGSTAAVAAVGRDLRRFIGEQTRYAALRDEFGKNRSFGHFTSFVAVFRQPIPTSGEAFEALLWQQLQGMHDHDEPDWDPTRSAIPGDPHFAFCFGGRAFFVVGFHPHSAEIPRRFGYCTLVFNSEYQIDRLHDEGRFLHFASTVRERYERLAGRMNPSVPADVQATQDETRVYSGVLHPETEPWACPFRVRDDVRGSREDQPPP